MYCIGFKSDYAFDILFFYTLLHVGYLGIS